MMLARSKQMMGRGINANDSTKFLKRYMIAIAEAVVVLILEILVYSQGLRKSICAESQFL
jgi:hypothetical protein